MIIQSMPGDRSRSRTCVNDLIALVEAYNLFIVILIKQSMDNQMVP